MKRLVYPIAALALMTASAFTFIASQDWKINDDYTIKFTSHDPSGTFGGLKGTVAFDENDLAASKFDVTIDVATINTGNGMKNNHAKSAKWFDAEKYPTIDFQIHGDHKNFNRLCRNRYPSNPRRNERFCPALHLRKNRQRGIVYSQLRY